MQLLDRCLACARRFKRTPILIGGARDLVRDYLTSRRLNENRFPSPGGFVFSGNFTLGETHDGREARRGMERTKALCLEKQSARLFTSLKNLPNPSTRVGGRERPRACLFWNYSGIVFSFRRTRRATVSHRYLERRRPDVFLRVSNGPEESGGTRNGFMRLHVSSRGRGGASSRWNFIRYVGSLAFERYIDVEGSEWNTQWRQLTAANVTKEARRKERRERGTWRVPMARLTREREG